MRLNSKSDNLIIAMLAMLTVSAVIFLFACGTAFADSESVRLQVAATDEQVSENAPFGGTAENHSFESAYEIAPGEVISESCTEEETDFYTFTVNGFGLVDISITDGEGKISDRYSVFCEEISPEKAESELTELEICYACGHYRSRIAPGKYYVKVKSPDSDSPDYTIKVDFTDESEGSFEREWNDTAETAAKVSRGRRYSGNLCCEDEDWFKVNAKAGKLIVEIWTSELNGADLNGGSVNCEVYDENMNSVGSLNTNYSGSTETEIEVQVGTYYVCIKGTLDCKDDYTLRMSCSGNTSAKGKSKANLKEPDIVSVVKVSSSNVKVSWKNTAGASGYQIYRMAKTGGKYVKKISCKTTKTSRIMAAVKGENYYKVRAYKKYPDGTVKYGPWSGVTKSKLECSK